MGTIPDPSARGSGRQWKCVPRSLRLCLRNKINNLTYDLQSQSKAPLMSVADEWENLASVTTTRCRPGTAGSYSAGATMAGNRDLEQGTGRQCDARNAKETRRLPRH